MARDGRLNEPDAAIQLGQRVVAGCPWDVVRRQPETLQTDLHRFVRIGSRWYRIARPGRMPRRRGSGGLPSRHTLAADIAGYSRLMAANEAGTHGGAAVGASHLRRLAHNTCGRPPSALSKERTRGTAG